MVSLLSFRLIIDITAINKAQSAGHRHSKTDREPLADGQTGRKTWQTDRQAGLSRQTDRHGKQSVPNQTDRLILYSRQTDKQA